MDTRVLVENESQLARKTPQFVLILILVAAGLGAGCIQPSTQPEEEQSTASAPSFEVEEEISEEIATGQLAAPVVDSDELEMRRELPDVIEAVMPSVVGVATERTVRQQQRVHPFFRQQVPQQRERTQQGQGSGVIVDASGVVLTNNHVIEGADRIRVTLSDGRELDAEVAGTDPSSDVAVLRILEVPDDLEAVGFGNSDSLRLGESVIAIGNPFGLSGTVTLGIVSAMGRANMGIVDYEDFIQTDAAINPGNSGGALINLDGELVGINTAILTRTGGYQGVGFAIPSNMAQMVMNSLLESGEVARGWLGVMIQPLTPELATALELAPGLRGVVVSDVQPGSPAEMAGLARGDVITSIDDQSVRTPSALRNTIGLRAPGAGIDIEFVRTSEVQEMEIVLGSLQDAQLPQHQRGLDMQPQDSGVPGLSLQTLDPEMRRQFGVPDVVRQGVVVTGVELESDAMKLQFREGDVILEVNRRAVSSVADFAAAYDGQRQNLFLLYRDGATIFMVR